MWASVVVNIQIMVRVWIDEWLGCLTLLNQDDTQDALQVLSKSGEWIHANRIKGALVVNIGDMVNGKLS
jgi:isopenicillin N synthase-like dioxygenase